MLFNKTKKKQIIANVRIAAAPWERMRGLMFEDAKKFNYALVFELPQESKLHAAIHMLFVFFPIDVVWLDSGKKVVDIVKGIQPFTPNYTPKKPAKYFVELPAGKSLGIALGDVLQW